MCTRECAVAYLDVLGFKYLVSREKHLADLSLAILDCFKSDFVAELSKQHGVEFAIFSDSILVRSKEAEPRYRELTNTVKFCSQLLSLSIYRRLPLRGAIAWGEIYWNRESDIRIGTPINEAVGWEGRQDWAGIMLAGSAMYYMHQHEACNKELGNLLFPLTKRLLPLNGEPRRKIKAGIVRPWVDAPQEYLRLAEILREIGLVSCNSEVQRKLEQTALLFERAARQSENPRTPTVIPRGAA